MESYFWMVCVLVVYVCLKMLLLHSMEKLVSIKLVYNQEVTSHQQTSVYSHWSKHAKEFTCFFLGGDGGPWPFLKVGKGDPKHQKRSFGSTWWVYPLLGKRSIHFMLPTNTWEIMSCLPNEEGEEFHTCVHHVYLAKATYGKGWFIHDAQLKLPTYCCTPGSTNIAGWEIHHEWRCINVSTIKHGGFPASYVSLAEFWLFFLECFSRWFQIFVFFLPPNTGLNDLIDPL